MESKNYIVPGLIAVIMMVIAALLTSLTVAREWERGTMEQLISTPVKSQELILGKLVPYFTIAMCDVLLAVQWITLLNPLRYFLVALRGIFLKGVGLSVLWPQLAALAIMGAALLWLVSTRFHKTLA